MNPYADMLASLNGKKTENPLMELKKTADNVQHPSGSEPALIHPFTRSSVKIRDNACIDIFCDTNLGIRLDPNLRNISVVTDGMRNHLGYLMEWILNCEEKHVGGHSTAVIGGNIYLEVVGHVFAVVGGNLQADVGGNANIKIGGNVDIENGGTVNWKSGGNMYFDAPNYFFA